MSRHGYCGGIAAIDTMTALPVPVETSGHYEFLEPLLRDHESRESFEFPAQYMFRNVPHPQPSDDYGAVLVSEMDRFGIEAAVLGMRLDHTEAVQASRDHPERIWPMYHLRPHSGMDGVHELRRAYEDLGIVGCSTFACGEHPQVAIDDRAYWPLYAECCELGLPVFICAGTPGPRVPLWPQKVELLDNVCYMFPELTVVTRHGCMPDVDLAVQLLLKWPNLYYSTSAMAPKHYPRAIIDFANTRGADKVIYAGYFPMGLSYDRIFEDLSNLELDDDVWPRFLRENALAVLKLDHR
ncbi:MAG: amidohydrolase family protein [Acidimicrobiia bacterium]|nr:amidohydrolase family protein [Acidimicrobiia bacterium]